MALGFEQRSMLPRELPQLILIYISRNRRCVGRVHKTFLCDLEISISFAGLTCLPLRPAPMPVDLSPFGVYQSQSLGRKLDGAAELRHRRRCILAKLEQREAQFVVRSK